jgi:2'-5' RNA ligase
MTTSSRDELRLFYALWPDDATRTGLMEWQYQMHGRKCAYDNLHITLAFLGPQPVSRIPLLKNVLDHLPAMQMTLTLDHLGYFPRKRIAWAGMHDAPSALTGLRHALIDALMKEGVWFDGASAFKPHVTLARDANLPPDLVFAPVVWRANHVVLVQSVTKPEGPAYQILASRMLDEVPVTSFPDGS